MGQRNISIRIRVSTGSNVRRSFPTPVYRNGRSIHIPRRGQGSYLSRAVHTQSVSLDTPKVPPPLCIDSRVFSYVVTSRCPHSCPCSRMATLLLPSLGSHKGLFGYSHQRTTDANKEEPLFLCHSQPQGMDHEPHNQKSQQEDHAVCRRRNLPIEESINESVVDMEYFDIGGPR